MKRHLSDGWLGPRRRRVLEAIVDTIVPGTTAAPDVEEHLATLARSVRVALVAALDMLEWSTMAYQPHRRFSRLARGDREAMLARASAPRLGRVAVRLVSAVTFLFHYDERSDR